MISQQLLRCLIAYYTPRYEVYRGYIVFAFCVIMFVCLSVCKLFFLSMISQQLLRCLIAYYTPRYEVYRGYIVFAFCVITFVCLSVCKLFFSVNDFSATT